MPVFAMNNSAVILTRILLLIAIAIGFSPTIVLAQQRPRVFITDSQSWETVGSAAGSGGTFAASSRGGARPQTAEIIKTFGERCPAVVVNNKQDKADYVVVLDHEGGKGYLQHRNKIAVFNKDGDAIVSRSTRSLGNSVQDGCDAIVADWSRHPADGPVVAQANAMPSQPQSTAPATQSATPIVGGAETSPHPARASATSAENASPSGATLDILSSPSGAEIEIDGAFGGSTPSSIGAVSGEHTVRISKKGYVPWERKIKISTGNVRVAAELEPVTVSDPPIPIKPAPVEQASAAQSTVPASSAATMPPAVMTSEPKVTSVAPEMKPSSPAAATSLTTTEEQGTASITSNPEGAEIFVDSSGRSWHPLF
jgi:hypothetical protein